MKREKREGRVGNLALFIWEERGEGTWERESMGNLGMDLLLSIASVTPSPILITGPQNNYCLDECMSEFPLFAIRPILCCLSTALHSSFLFSFASPLSITTYPTPCLPSIPFHFA